MARLGTTKRPAVVRVTTREDAHQVMELCESRGWKVVVGVEPDEPPDTSDVEKLLAGRNVEASRALPPGERVIGRASSCPCGSGKRYKRCCGPR